MVSLEANPIIDIVSGGFSGVTSVLSSHCFDTLKVRIQVLPHSETSDGFIKTTIQCFRKIIRNEGALALFKGIQPPLVGAIPSYAFYFFTYNLGKNMQKPASDNGQYHYTQILVAGAFAGTLSVVPTVIVENVKCLIQVDTANKYNGVFDCMRKLYTTHGSRGVFKGSLLTLYRDAPASGLHFVIYEHLKKHLRKDDTNLSPVAIVFAGGASAAVYWLYALPFDTLKTFYQTNDKYTNMFDAYRDLTRIGGVKSLYRGIIPVLTSTFPGGAACFLGYEVAYSFILSCLHIES